MISYNHERYILEALESIAMQDFDSPIEIVIGDDVSSDGTQELIRNFKAAHPQFVWKDNLRKTNVGIAKNFAETILSCTGEYIAVLEGDDYWVHREKLKKQVEVLDKNPLYSICYTTCREVNADGIDLKVVTGDRPASHDLKYLLREGWFMRTPTLMFRNGLVKKFPNWYYSAYSTDYILHILLNEKGLAGKLDMVSAAYRKHINGVSVVNANKRQDRYNVKMSLLDTIDAHFNLKFRRDIANQKDRLYQRLVLDGLKNKIVHKNILKHFRFGGLLGLFRHFLGKLIFWQSEGRVS